MVTSYYIMKLLQNKRKLDFRSYYKDLFDELSINSNYSKALSKCRICFKKRDVMIFDTENFKDITEILYSISGIIVNKEDQLSTGLCVTCHKFLNSAILFKQVAQKSDQLLQLSVKNESGDEQYEEHSTQSNNLIIDDIPTPENQINEPCKISNESETIANQRCSIKENMALKITCEVCNKTMNMSYYKVHVTMHDPNHPDHNKYVCDICGKSFRLHCSYYNHTLRHKTEFSFKCQVCPYRARYSELLKRHMCTHTRDYRYMCTECPARFIIKSNLNKHIIIKHRAPQFKCDNCKKEFHTKPSLQKHFEADHLGLKNHVCNICGKAFGYRKAMMQHERLVHKREKLGYKRMPSYLKAELNQGQF